MIRNSFITMMLALVTVTGLAQTKTATVTGYSPALKDGTLVLAGTGTIGNVVDTVKAGHFAFTLPVEELTESFLGNPLPASRCDCEIDGHRLFLPFMEN